MKKIVFILTMGLLVCGGCAQRSHEVEMSQLQIREIQSRTFSSQDSKVVLKEMVNVMQDDQFIVKNASFDLGLLTGEKDVDISKTFEKSIKTIL